MAKRINKDSVAEIVKDIVPGKFQLGNTEEILHISKGWTIHIKKRILDDDFVEYLYTAYDTYAQNLKCFPHLQPGLRGVHMGYYYPSENTLHILC